MTLPEITNALRDLRKTYAEIPRTLTFPQWMMERMNVPDMSLHDKLRFEYEMEVKYTGPSFAHFLCDKIEKIKIQYDAELEAVKTRTRWNEEEAKGWKEKWEYAVIDGDLLRTKNEELQERVIEAESDYQDICELASELCLPMERQWLIDQVGRENWERFKNHIGW